MKKIVDPTYDPQVINNSETDHECEHKAHQHYNCCSADKKHHDQAHPDCTNPEHHHHEHCCADVAVPVATQCCSQDTKHHQVHHADCQITEHHHHQHDSCCSDDHAHHQAVHTACTTTHHHHHQHGHNCCSEDEEHHAQDHADCKVVGHHHHHHDCMQDQGHMHNYSPCEHEHEHYQCCSRDSEHHKQEHPECHETAHHHHQHCCSDTSPTTKPIVHNHHEHNHDHSCCGHDHSHEHHGHNCCGHDYSHEQHQHHCCGHDHSHCNHDHTHQHSAVDLAEFDELYHEQGCGCGHDHSHDHEHSNLTYKPVADYSKSLQAQAKLASQDPADNLIHTDLSAFMSNFKLLHDKLYPQNSFYHALGLIYGAVATDYEDLEFVSKQYLETTNSKVNRDYLDFALKTFTYIQANYLYEDFYLNDLFASFDKSANGVEKLTNYDLFLDAYCFAALFGLSKNEQLDSEVVNAASYILKDLNTFGMVSSQLAVDINYKASKIDKPAARAAFLELGFDPIGEGYDEQEELSLTIARDAVKAAKGETLNPQERFDLSPVLSLAVETTEE